MAMPMIPSIGMEKLKKNEKEVIRTVIGCFKCDNPDIVREYQPGDIVFKETGEKCSKCGTILIVKQVYAEIVKDKS